MNHPLGIWCNSTTLVVVDSNNHRVLLWSPLPLETGKAADHELGWSDFGMGGGAPISPPTRASLNYPSAAVVAGSSIFVADYQNNRVMVWNGIPSTNGVDAAFVLGQGDFASNQVNAGSLDVNAVGFSGPSSLLVAHSALFVSDGGNNRLMVFSPTPTQTGTSASAVLGAPDLITMPPVLEGSAAQFFAIEPGLAVVGNELFVVDSRRVLGSL